MERKPYKKAGLFMGVISGIGFPPELRERVEREVGEIEEVSETFPFDFTSYYDDEIGGVGERFFVLFKDLIEPDSIGRIKLITNEIEKEWGRRVDLDPGYISEASVVLATTKDRAHRVAIGEMLYAEVTMIYHRTGWETFQWTYPDYRTERVQKIMTGFRKRTMEKRVGK